MNDFTKEELGIIYCNLCINPKTKDVLAKIESLFENYCEHIEEYEDLNYQPMRCKKCLEITG
jgi:hypothetical protein